ncbi:hypothetical protein [Burkholderia sp. 4M9327F10]|uniref:hypothetical protein n=1 Tax=Burkholderia sp. 4M9327F10 TaxID=2502223 RepID=UPI0010F6CECE|nr:hypothetical protein [Burkholderia sp. 4M9327F10]
MEHLVRVQNERDRQILAWLRGQVGDATLAAAAQAWVGPGKPYVSRLCRRLGVRPPSPMRVDGARATAHVEVGERHLAVIRQILARPRSEASQAG